jgi:hypothetical protein
MSVDFSSWPREQEQSFQVYEQQQQASSRQALIIGLIAGAVAFVFAVGVYASVEPNMRDLSKDMNMSNLSKKTTKTEAPAATPDKK